jgi:hypothetical protein
MDVDMEAEVSFTNEDGTTAAAEDIIVNSAEGPGKNVTVRADENGGYSMSYRLSSNTHSHTVVAQFAMRAVQSVHISGLGGGTNYYVYEYASDENGEADRNDLAENWTTEIEITPQGAQQGTQEITDALERVIPEYRAATGVIRTNATQKVAFTNSAKTGNLIISKTVTEEDISEGENFRFTITLKDEDGNPLVGSYPYTGGTISGTETEAPAGGKLTLDVKGSATVTLFGGQKVTIEDLPVGTRWTVQEEASENYKITATAMDGSPTGGAVITRGGS